MRTVRNIIEEYLTRKDIDKAEVARLLKTSPQNFGKKLKAKLISVELVKDISDAVDHNFFEDLAAEWNRAHFNIENVVTEQSEKYSPATFEKYLEQMVERKLKQMRK